MEEGKEIETDRHRAEVFDALGHPTRIAILKALSEDALGFAELKKKTSIESSGHLQHHLTKLDGLIKTDEYGKYCLSDQGKDALLTVQTVENISSTKKETKKPSHRFNTLTVLKSASLLLVALLIASSAIAVLEYNQISALQKDITRFSSIDFEATAYYNEFGVIPYTNVNSSFSPPVSMYHALQMALRNEGWNKTSLSGMRVGASLMNCKTVTDPAPYTKNNITLTPFGTSINGPVTTPPSDYANIYGDGAIYRYVWQIVVNNSTGFSTPPRGFTLIDASTGQILPNPPLY